MERKIKSTHIVAFGEELNGVIRSYYCDSLGT